MSIGNDFVLTHKKTSETAQNRRNKGKDGQAKRRTDKKTDGKKDGQKKGWTEKWMDGQKDGRP